MKVNNFPIRNTKFRAVVQTQQPQQTASQPMTQDKPKASAQLPCASTASGILQAQGYQPNITPTPNYYKIDVGYINDFHGQLTKMERTIEPLKKCDIRLSGGDNFLGDERNIPLNKGVSKFLSIAGYDASPIGNHELDMDQKSFMSLTKDLKTKFVNVNYRQEINDPNDAERIYKETNKAPINDRFTKSFTKEINGTTYGFLGVAPVDINDRYTHPDYYSECKIDNIDDTIKDVQKEVDNLESKGVNKIFLLSHLGYKLDKEVAKRTSGVDVIIGGHSHDLVKGITKDENLLYSKSNEPVIITNAGKDGEYFGNLKLEFDEKGIIKKAQNNVIPTVQYGRNLIYKKLIEENPQANFIADAIKNELGVEMAFLNSANLRSSFEKGEFTNLDAKMISPFNNQMVIANVTEKDLVDAFKFTSKTMVNSRPGLFAVSGIKYSVRKSDGELLSMSKVDDKGNEIPIDIKNPSPIKTYRVSADSFVLRGGDRVSSLNYAGREEKVFEFDKDKLLCDYIKHLNKPIDINQTGRVNIVE